jgi:branched-subunit amino acid aminotransferase/4-amino-4-deoxychorismate lyase
MSQDMVFLNGALVPAADASVSVFDTGLLHGASVFTTLRSHHGKPFRLDRHLARLMDHAARIGLRHGADPDRLTMAVTELLAANGCDDARIRITLTPGAIGAERPTTLVTTAPLVNDPEWYTGGISVMVCGVRQYVGDPTVGLKTGCYLTRILARQAAAAHGDEEALWFSTSGHLAEACFSNVFLVLSGRLLTPPLKTPVLGGIVRQAVFDIAAEMDIDCSDQDPLGGDELSAAEEVLLTSSGSGIRPVVRINKQPVGNEKPGPIATKLIAAYDALLEAECPAD